MSQRVVITGMGAVAPNGNGIQEFISNSSQKPFIICIIKIIFLLFFFMFPLKNFLNGSFSLPNIISLPIGKHNYLLYQRIAHCLHLMNLL